ncbi:MAG: hypothetical protein LQ351_001954 [Letrouitia transgressa]|nr:MAG: hypothetical protein LQ351_001954 [Letrouitia transgressa]
MNKFDRTGLGGEHKEGLLEYTVRKAYGGITTHDSKRVVKSGRPTVLDIDYSEGDNSNSAEREVFGGSNSSGYISDGSAVRQDEELDTPNTQLSSIASSEDGGSTLYEVNAHSTSKPPPNAATIVAFYRRQASRGQYDSEKAEVNNKEAGEDKDEEEQNNNGSDSYEKNTPRPIRKRSRSTAIKKIPIKRAIKRRRFSLPLLSDEETEEMGDESDVSSYTPTEPYRTISLRSASPHSTCLGGEISDDREIEKGGQSK